MHRPLAALALALLLAPAALPFGAAFHDPGVPLRESRDYTGEAYAAWRLRMEPGERAVIEAEVNQDAAGLFSVGTWVIELNPWTRLASGAVTWVTGQGDTLHLGAEPLGNLIHVRQNGRPYPATFGAYPFTAPRAGEYLLVTLAGSENAVHGRLRMFADLGVEVLGASAGAGYFHAEADFPAAVNVVARVHDTALGDVVVKAVQGAAVPQRVEGRLFALFQGFSNSGDLTMGFDGPAGASDGRTFYFLHGEPTGDYTFRIDQNIDTWDSGGVCPSLWNRAACFYEAPVWAVGADVRVP